MDTLVRLDKVSKIYPRVHQPWERLQAFGSILRGREPASGARVLTDISLEVTRGESLGIIGQNGAGKSTLLKILTGVIRPTTGKVRVNAKIAALLELGAGFQPDFSGMDNVRMKAALLGMSRQDVNRKLDYILDFAGIGEYIHEPVKHYSSGMVVRLGFAVVAASEPELLITDEVLAVGDESFQNKCVHWIESFRQQGGTLLMVSHSMYLVQKLCRHALWLMDGRAHEQGDVYPVTQAYLAFHEARTAAQQQHDQAQAAGNGSYRVHALRIHGEEGASTPLIRPGDDLMAELTLVSPDGRPPVGMVGIVRADGTPVYGVATDHDGADNAPRRLDGNLYLYRVRFKAVRLLPGSYQFRGHAMDPEGVRVFDTEELPFTVSGETNELGLVRLEHEWLN